MTLSLRLREQGFEVSLMESGLNLGGLTSPARIGNYTWDQFYHVILASDTNLISLFEQLNLKDEIHWEQTKTGFFTEGHLYSMSDIIEFLTFPPLALIDKLRLGFTIFYASKIKSWERLEEISVTDWLIQLSGNHTFQKIWLPLLKSKLGENYRLSSASFIWAIIARMYAARRSGLKKEMFGYVKGGYATILSRFENFLSEGGVHVTCGAPIIRIENDKSGVNVNGAHGKVMRFDDVILTVPSNKISSICPELSLQEKKRLDGVNYQGVICLALILKKPFPGYYVTNITDEWVPFTGVIEMTAVVNQDHFDGNSLVYLPRYLPQEDAFWNKSDDEIQGKFIKALELMYPSFSKDDVLASKITRASHVHPITTINYSRELLPPTQTSLNHVFIVNSAQIANGTMNVNEIIGLANRKSKEIKKLLS